MNEVETKRQVMKLRASQRAQRRLENRLADIDWEIDVLVPQVEAVKAGELTVNSTAELVESTDESR